MFCRRHIANSFTTLPPFLQRAFQAGTPPRQHSRKFRHQLLVCRSLRERLGAATAAAHSGGEEAGFGQRQRQLAVCRRRRLRKGGGELGCALQWQSGVEWSEEQRGWGNEGVCDWPGLEFGGLRFLYLVLVVIS